MLLERQLRKMDRTPANFLKNNQFNVTRDLTSKRFVVDCDKITGPININIDERVSANILIINLKNADISLHLDKSSSALVSFLAKEEAKQIKIQAVLEKYAEIDVYFADFISGENHSNITIDLNGEEAAAAWHLASLAHQKDKKSFDVSVYHNTKNTYCKLDNYGVCLNESNLTFSGICKINEGCSGSKAHQNAKIMVFDEACKGIAKPILKIDENNIEASHAAVVGKINDEHLFYLTSRGLSEAEAKELITLGYLKPILKGFDDEDVNEEINKLIEGRM